MSIIQGLNFDNALNFNSSGIDFSGGLARLLKVLNTGQTFNQPFTSATGFTYDAAKAEFVGGLLRQKDQRPNNAILGAKFNSTKNANWDYAGSSLTATDTGSPVINAGYIDCIGAVDVGVSYINTSLALVTNNGSIKFKFKPNYNGAPATSIGLASIAESGGGLANKISLGHSSGGNLALFAYNSAGVIIASNLGLGSFVAVSGTEYEFELCWDTATPNRNFSMFINGVLLSSNTVGSMTRTNTATKLSIGRNSTTLLSNGSFKEVVVFNTTQHIVGYTPGYTLPDFSYVESLATLPVFTYSGVGFIQALSNLATTQVNTTRFIIKGQYWNGSAWVASSDTFVTASTLAQVIAHAATLSVAGDSTITVKVVFEGSNTLSSIDDLTLTYSGQKYSLDGWAEPLQGIYTQALISLNQLSSDTANSTVKTIIKVDGVFKYWNGSAWVTSNESFAQSNTMADINTNIATLTFAHNSTVVFRFLINTTVTTETATLTWADIEYNFGAISSVAPVVLVYGYYKDISGNPVASATVKFSLLKNSGDYKEASNAIIEKGVSVITDANGYFQCSLIRSSAYENGGVYQVSITKASDKLSVTKTAAGELLTFLAPDLVTKDITQLFIA
jgi:hypothetical protein